MPLCPTKYFAFDWIILMMICFRVTANSSHWLILSDHLLITCLPLAYDISISRLHSLATILMITLRWDFQKWFLKAIPPRLISIGWAGTREEYKVSTLYIYCRTSCHSCRSCDSAVLDKHISAVFFLSWYYLLDRHYVDILLHGRALIYFPHFTHYAYDTGKWRYFTTTFIFSSFSSSLSLMTFSNYYHFSAQWQKNYVKF